MATPPLPPDLTQAVLDYFGVTSAPPTLMFLDSLLMAYARTVPWETAFRIVKRARTMDTRDCPRWPDEFWCDALEHGGGGTCFESNYAFFSLLRALGYDGYLTINNMGATIGCHTAIVIEIDGNRWLADAGLPVYVALQLNPEAITERESPFHHYTVRPDGPTCYQIECRPHPRLTGFTLIDKPVSDAHYRSATIADYSEKGLFLDQVIVNKVIDGQQWRFTRDESLHLEVFNDGVRTDHPIQTDLAEVIAGHFKMDANVVRAALAATGS